jgi:hypothetical protein
VVARGRRRQGGGLSFREAAARYVADRMRDPAAAWTAQTRAQNEATFRLFADYAGDAVLASIWRDDVAEFLSTVARLPRLWALPGSQGAPPRRAADALPWPALLDQQDAEQAHVGTVWSVPLGSTIGLDRGREPCKRSDATARRYDVAAVQSR